MSKTIKLEEDTYQRVDDLRGKRDTFSDVVKLLLDTREALFMMINTLEGNVKYAEFRREQLQRQLEEEG